MFLNNLGVHTVFCFFSLESAILVLSMCDDTGTYVDKIHVMAYMKLACSNLIPVTNRIYLLQIGCN